MKEKLLAEIIELLVPGEINKNFEVVADLRITKNKIKADKSKGVYFIRTNYEKA